MWWVDDHPRLNRSVRDRIDTEDDVRISAISLLEIATAVSRGRLTLTPSIANWLQIAQAAEQVRVEPLTAALCLHSTTLPGMFHRDPGDRLIVALARQLNVEVVTADRKILAYTDVRSLPAE